MKITRGVLVVLALAVLLSLTFVAISAVISRREHHSVTLTWHAPEAVEGVSIAGYNVYRSITPGGPYVRIAIHVKDITYRDLVVRNKTTYFYVVTSLDMVGNESKFSAEASVTIP